MREPSKRGVDDRAANRREREQVSRTDDIGKIEHGAQERAHDESDLHRQRQPTSSGFAETPFSG